jgi:aquaporin TIP
MWNFSNMNLKALIAEFVGTFIFVFIGVGAIASQQLTVGALDLNWIAVAHGLAVAVTISATAAISGGHLNPSVTFGVWLVGKIDTQTALGYVISQCLGGILAALSIELIFPSEVWQAIGKGVPTLGQGVSPVVGVFVEFLLTFFVVFVVFGTAIDARSPKLGGLFIGLTVILDILVGGSVSGAVMNPARYLGPAIVAGDFPTFWLYWVGPLAGGAAAALTYHYAFAEREESEPTVVSSEIV